MADLQEAKAFIISEIKQTSLLVDEPNVVQFFENLVNGSFHSHRLLWNIAIDLKFKNVIAENYATFFNKLSKIDASSSATKEFDELNKLDSYWLKYANRRINESIDYYNSTDAFSFFKYIIKNDDISENSNEDLIFITFDRDGKVINDDFYETFTDKILPSRPNKTLWLTNKKGIDDSFLDVSASVSVFNASNICSRLGLPLPEFEKYNNDIANKIKPSFDEKIPEENRKHRLLVIIPKSRSMETVVTNAFCDSYYQDPKLDPNVIYFGLFLSNSTQLDNWGQTFTRTGMMVGGHGIDERVVSTITMNGEETVKHIGKMDRLPLRNVDNFLLVAQSRFNT